MEPISVGSAAGKETMARKTNYKFDRMERERQKAAKKAARAEAKKEKAEQRKAEPSEPDLSDRLPE